MDGRIFTVVGWSPVAASPSTSVAKARPASWEVLVVLGTFMLTWPWEYLKSYKTLEEWAELDAVP